MNVFQKILKFAFALFEIGQSLLVRKHWVPFYDLSRIIFKYGLSFNKKNDTNSNFYRFAFVDPYFNSFENKKNNFIAWLARIEKLLIIVIF